MMIFITILLSLIPIVLFAAMTDSQVHHAINLELKNHTDLIMWVAGAIGGVFMLMFGWIFKNIADHKKDIMLIADKATIHKTQLINSHQEDTDKLHREIENRCRALDKEIELERERRRTCQSEIQNDLAKVKLHSANNHVTQQQFDRVVTKLFDKIETLQLTVNAHLANNK